MYGDSFNKPKPIERQYSIGSIPQNSPSPVKIHSPQIQSPQIQSPARSQNQSPYQSLVNSPITSLPSSPNLYVKTKPQQTQQSTPQIQQTLQNEKKVVVKKDYKNISYDYEPKTYKNEEIETFLRNHFLVEPEYWDHIPVGQQIKYFRKPVGNEPKNNRFRQGGYVRKFIISGGKKRILLSKRFRGGDTYSIAYEEIEEIYKHYDYNSRLELVMIFNSLMDKNRRINELEKRIISLEKKFSIL
jgi:hypothetical protein